MNPEKKYGMVVELDQDGRVINSWQSPDGTFEDFSEGYLHTDGYIYLGSPYNTYIARVKYDSWIICEPNEFIALYKESFKDI